MRRSLLPVVLLLLAVAVWMLVSSGAGPTDDSATRGSPDAAADVDPALLRGHEAADLGDVEADDAARQPDLPPAETWEAMGRVVDAKTKAGIADALVHLELVRGDVHESVGKVTTREDGTFHVPLPRLDELSQAQLAPSRLVAFARADGYWQDVYTKYPKTLYRVPADRRATGTLHLRPGPTVHGRVLDFDGVPVPGAWVLISWWISPTRRRDVGTSRYTDNAGEYRLPRRTPHRHYKAMVVSAQKRGGAQARLLVPVDRDSLPDRLPDLIFERPGTGTVTGQAVFPDGTPAADVDLLCRIRPKDTLSATARTRTDSAGRFEFSDLPSGDGYACAVRSPHWVSPMPGDIGWVDVTTGARDVVLELARPRVRIWVVDDEGSPVAGARWIARIRGDGRPASQNGIVHGADGIAYVWGRPGQSVAVGAWSHGLRSTEAVVDLSPGVWTHDVTLTVLRWQRERYGALRVSATRPDGTEVTSVRLRLRTPLTEWSYPCSPGGSERHSRDDSALMVPPGRWWLVLTPTVAPGDWIEQRHEIEIQPGRELVFETTVEIGGMLCLDVRDPRPETQKRVTNIRLVPDDGARDPIFRTVGERYPTHGPQFTRRWRFAPGGWTLYVDAPGCCSVTERVFIKAGESEVVDVVLVPE